MTVITITRAAKCKDCKFLKPIKDRNLKRHYCTNQDSERYNQFVTLKDLVCSSWGI